MRRRGATPGVIQGQQTEANAHGHGLPIVEPGVGRPLGIVDMGFVEVSDEGAQSIGESRD